MKNVILIISMILVPFKFCLAQDLDVDKVLNNWDSVYNGFITELQKDELFPDIKKNRNPLYCRIANKDYFKNGIPPDGKSKRWEIIKDHYKTFSFDDSTAKVYEAIRVKYIESLKKNGYAKTPSTNQKGNGKDKDKGKDKNQKSKSNDKDVIANLNKEVDGLKQENKILVDSIVRLKQANEGLEQRIEQLETTEETEDGNSNVGFWIVFAIALVELCVIIVLKKRKDSVKYRNNVLKKQISKLKEKSSDLHNEIDQLKGDKSNLDSQITVLQDSEEKLKKQNSQKDETIQNLQREVNSQSKQQAKGQDEPKSVPVQQPQKGRNRANDKYLCQINADGFFGRVQDTNDGSIYYCMFDIQDGEASFEFCGNQYEAIQKYNSVLDSVANYSGNPDNAKNIRNICPGRVRLDSSTGRYDVITPVKLELY